VPLPLDPQAALRLIDVTVRDDDVVLSFRFGDAQ